MNIRKDLRDLFRKSLINKRNSTVSYYPSRSTTNYRGTRIYFYEWSDIYRVPRTFDDISAFDDYLKGCGIYMQMYQREIIINCGTAYATCYKGSKELNLKGSYAKLFDSMKEHDKLSNELNKLDDIDKKKEDPFKEGLPPMYKEQESQIKRPEVLMEPESRWSDYDDEFGGYWY